MGYGALSCKTIAGTGFAPRRTTRSQNFYSQVWNASMDAFHMASIIQCF